LAHICGFRSNIHGKAQAEANFEDGTKFPVQVAKRVWRSPIKSTYNEPETELAPLSNLEWQFEEKGRVVATPREKKQNPRTGQYHPIRPNLPRGRIQHGNTME
jgi:hypothetical protein